MEIYLLTYVLPRGFSPFSYSVCPTSCISMVSSLCLDSSLPFSLQKDYLYLLPSHWLFSFLLHQLKQDTFIQCTNIPKHYLTNEKSSSNKKKDYFIVLILLSVLEINYSTKM